MGRPWSGIVLSLTALAVVGTVNDPFVSVAADPRFDVLLFTKTAGFRHDSIEDGARALQELAAANDFTVERTDDAAVFEDDAVGRFEAVVFLSTTGDILNSSQQDGLRSYIEGGRGFVGIHAAADAEYEWEWYGGLVSAFFEEHPPGTPEADVRVVDAGHPSTSHLMDPWTRTDEWYDYRSNPFGEVRTLLRVDESSYDGGSMGAMHPISWCQSYSGGRSWYTGMGHTSETYSNDDFRRHLLKGLEWAAGAIEANCTPQAVAARTSIRARAGAFAGRITSKKSGCSGERAVVLKRHVRGPDPRIARGRSGTDGRWRISSRARPRGVYAVLPEKHYTATFSKEVRCRRNQSRPLEG